jgi:hypothetical protein
MCRKASELENFEEDIFCLGIIALRSIFGKPEREVSETVEGCAPSYSMNYQRRKKEHLLCTESDII